jgi:methionyl-tRNA formyltransferase
VGIIEAAARTQIGYKNSFFKFPWRKTLKGLSRKHHIPYYYMNNGCDDTLQQWVRKLDPDIIVVYSMSQLLKENIFTIPKHGSINLHSAYLPEYRGPNPIFWMYYNVDLNPGFTVHYIDKGEDTGDIIYRERYTIPLGMKSSDMLDIGINKIGINLLFKALDTIATATAPRIRQPQNSPTPRARNLKLEEHKTIIDWNNWSVERVWHILRGTESWLNVVKQPSGIYNGQRWNIDDFEKYENNNNKKYVYGSIYRENDKVFIACLNGKIYISIKINLKAIIKNCCNYFLSLMERINITPPPPIEIYDYYPGSSYFFDESVSSCILA